MSRQKHYSSIRKRGSEADTVLFRYARGKLHLVVFVNSVESTVYRGDSPGSPMISKGSDWKKMSLTSAISTRSYIEPVASKKRCIRTHLREEAWYRRRKAGSSFSLSISRAITPYLT